MALTDKLTAIADAIRAKTGGSALMTLDDMPDEIASISGGGGGNLDHYLYYLFQDGTSSGTDIVLTANDLNSITTIRQYAFYQMHMADTYKMTFGRAISIIGRYAFCGSYLTEITLSGDHISVGESAFSYCPKLTAVKGQCKFEVRESSVFRECAKLEAAPALSTYYSTILGSSYFYNCAKLQTVTLPDTLTGIGSSAFFGCKALTSFNIPPSVQSISSSVFNSCTNLERVTIGTPSGGSNCTRIASTNYGEVLHNCPAFKALVIYAETPPALSSTYLWNGSNTHVQGAFPDDGYIYVPDTSVEAYKTATNWSAYASHIKPMSELPTT